MGNQVEIAPGQRVAEALDPQQGVRSSPVDSESVCSVTRESMVKSLAAYQGSG